MKLSAAEWLAALFRPRLVSGLAAAKLLVMDTPPPRIGPPPALLPGRSRRAARQALRGEPAEPSAEEVARLDAARTAIVNWTREALRLPATAPVRVVEEPHCVDPGCPLRRTTIAAWHEAHGRLLRFAVTKPMLYLRQPDIEREADTAE